MVEFSTETLVALILGSSGIGVAGKLAVDTLLKSRRNGKTSQTVNVTLPEVGEDTEEYVTQAGCDRSMKAVEAVIGAKMGETKTALEGLQQTTHEGFKGVTKKIEEYGAKITEHEIAIQVLKQTG